MKGNQPMSTTQQKVQNTALEMFRKYKGTYSQNDMEKIVEEAIQQERHRCADLVDKYDESSDDMAGFEIRIRKAVEFRNAISQSKEE